MKSLLRSHTAAASSSSSSAEASSSSVASSPPSSSWTPLRSLLVISSSAHDSDRLKSPWSRRKRKHALSRHQWKDLFTPDGKFRDGGIKFLKKVRCGGVDPSIRAEVWPFLLAVYDLNSSEAERDGIKTQRRKEYMKLRRRCHQLMKPMNGNESPIFINAFESFCSEDEFSARHSFEEEHDDDISQPLLLNLSDNVIFEEEEEEEDESDVTHVNASSESEGEFLYAHPEKEQLPPVTSKIDKKDEQQAVMASLQGDLSKVHRTAEDFITWQRIIHKDALRASPEWIVFSPKQAAVTEDRARKRANAVGLKDYENLEPCMIYHAARLIAILESYALYDQETGYCQGMSDLLSPIIAVMEKDYEAFWCFVGFMRKARHNFRLDEVGIRRQLNVVSKIIKTKDAHLYRHLEKLKAEDCFFVYRMVVVLFRRELTFEQTLCLWEVMWADQAAIRAIGKSARRKMKMKAPPTDDLILYAIAACVLQRRKLIIEKYSSMDEIVKECNNMTGHLDVWKLLDDAHDLVIQVAVFSQSSGVPNRVPTRLSCHPHSVCPQVQPSQLRSCQI